MIAIRVEPYYAQLKKRRSELLKTLEHVQNEQREIDENKEWIDEAAYLRRRCLLDGLVVWYSNEASRIDRALLRISEGSFGICLACHEPIQARDLEAAPQTALCGECQKRRDRIETTAESGR